MAKFTVLEPMSTGDVIDRAVRIYRRNFVPLILIVAVPAFFGYVVKLLVSFGYTSLVMGAADQAPNFRGDALVMMLLGMVGYPIWGFLVLLTISGLSRVVGDQIMLAEPITFRRCVGAIRKRLGAITLMGLLGIALLFFAYIVLFIFLFIAILAISAVAGVAAAAQLPPWAIGTIFGIIGLVAVAAIIFFVLSVVARIVFMPQIVMIEGQGAAQALGRAITLGKGNWYKVGGIALFTYFFQLSLFAALTIPVLVAFYLQDMIGPEFFISPTWSIIQTTFDDVAGLLSFPIWIVSFTLLYFDSRVRKEAYDLELLAREVSPGFIWQPTMQPSAFGYQVAVQPGQRRTWVQTSPLGLGGYPQAPAEQVPPATEWPPGAATVGAQVPPDRMQPTAMPGQDDGQETSWPSVEHQTGRFSAAPTEPVVASPESPPEPGRVLGESQSPDLWRSRRGPPVIESPAVSREPVWCRRCGASLGAADLFCMQCGNRVEPEPESDQQ